MRRLKIPTKSRRNRFKFACEASTQSRFWQRRYIWELIWLRAFS
jgi:hypothetical protein